MLSVPALVHGILARALAQAAVRVLEHNSHVSVSSASLALGRARTHSLRLIQGIDGASRSSIDLVLGRVPQTSFPPVTGAVRLGDTSDVDGSEGALSNPESQPYVRLARRWWYWQLAATTRWGACTYA